MVHLKAKQSAWAKDFLLPMKPQSRIKIIQQTAVSLKICFSSLINEHTSSTSKVLTFFKAENR